MSRDEMEMENCNRSEELKNLDRADLEKLLSASYTITVCGVAGLILGPLMIFLALLIFSSAGAGAPSSKTGDVWVFLLTVGSVFGVGFLSIMTGIGSIFRTKAGRIYGILLGVFFLLILLVFLFWGIVSQWPPRQSWVNLGWLVYFLLIYIDLRFIKIYFYADKLFGSLRYSQAEVLHALKIKNKNKPSTVN